MGREVEGKMGREEDGQRGRWDDDQLISRLGWNQF